MSKYFGWIDGKPYDFTFKRRKVQTGWCDIFLGEHLICTTIRTRRGSYSIIGCGDRGSLLVPNLVEGFATRWDALQYGLKIHHLTRSTYNRR